MRQKPPVERALARPDHVRDEVLVTELVQPPCDLRVDLGPLAGENQKLLGSPAHGLVEPLFHLLGLVQVRAVGRERAVLAVAAAGARQ